MTGWLIRWDGKEVLVAAVFPPNARHFGKLYYTSDRVICSLVHQQLCNSSDSLTLSQRCHFIVCIYDARIKSSVKPTRHLTPLATREDMYWRSGDKILVAVC